MAVTKVLTTRTVEEYTFRYEEVREGQHGRDFCHSAPLHAVLTFPQGTVKVSTYGIKESKSIEVALGDIPALISILENCLTTGREKMLLRVPTSNQ